MAATPRTKFRVTFSPRDLGSFLDMLRYDAAVVIEWDHATEPLPSPSSTLAPRERERFTVTLATSAYPTVGRWESFSLYLRDAETGERLR